MSLAKHLATQQQVLRECIRLMEQEQRLISTATIDGQQLATVAERKREVLAEIERLETIRTRAQHRLGYPEGRVGSEKAARDARCFDAWQALIELAERARQLNELNGRMIKMRMEQNQRILNFLSEAAGQSLYGPNGQARRQSLVGLSSKA